MALGRPQDALQSYDRSVRLNPDNSRAHLARARALVRLSRLDEARAAVCAARQLDPTLTLRTLLENGRTWSGSLGEELVHDLQLAGLPEQ